MNEDLFATAEAEVGAAISRAVTLAGGDAERALEELLAWAGAAGPERQRLVFQATRRRVGAMPTPALDAVVAESIAEIGDDAARCQQLIAEATDPLEQPTTRDRIERELVAAAREALAAWVEDEAWRWREGRG